MSRIRIIGLAFVAVLALSAVAVASASAAWQNGAWMVKKGGEFEPLTTPVNVVSKGAVILKNGEQEFECETTSEGTVETGGKDKITKVTATKVCVMLKRGDCSGTQPSGLPEFKPKNLPWNTQLESEGTSYRDKITSGGAGEPGWGVKCAAKFLGNVEDECHAPEETATITNNANKVSFNAKFSGVENPNSVCKGNSTATHGSIGGSVEVEPTAAEKTAGVEGIEASAGWQNGKWETKEVGAWKSVTGAVGVVSEGTLTIKQNGEIEYECKITSEGTVETGGKDKITKVTPENPCRFVKAGGCNATQPAGLPEFTPQDLPWNTQLEDESTSGEIRDKITTGGSGNPGWGLKCATGGGTTVELECRTVEELTTITNAVGGFNAKFSGIENPTSHCTSFGLGEHDSIEGTIEVKLPPSSGYEGVRAK